MYDKGGSENLKGTTKHPVLCIQYLLIIWNDLKNIKLSCTLDTLAFDERGSAFV